MLHWIITRTMKLLTRRGASVKEQGATDITDNDGDSDEARAFGPLHVAGRTCRTAQSPTGS